MNTHASSLLADHQEEDLEPSSCSWMLPRCWKAFLPSVPSKLELIEETSPKSVRFRLDLNTTRLINLPLDEEEDCHSEPSLFVDRNDMCKAQLDMELTARYFRDRQPGITSSPEEEAEELSTIGLEWLIWPDNRVERRHDILEAIEFYSNNSLACICQVISSVSRREAQLRAERVVQELRKDQWISTTIVNTPTNKMTKNSKHQPGRWIINLRTTTFQERIMRIPIMSPRKTTYRPETCSVPKGILCSPPAA